MKKLLTFLTLFLVAIGVFAVPAERGQKRILTLSDGTTVEAELVGDEWGNYWRSADGRAFVLDKMSGKEQIFKMADAEKIESEARKMRDDANRLFMNRSPRKIVGEFNELKGEKKCLIILVEFQDTKFQVYDGGVKALFENIANKKDFGVNDDSNPFEGSMRDYFLAQSDGQFTVNFDVVGPVTVSKDHTYYGQNVGNTNTDMYAAQMVREAIILADPYVNYKDYDWDGDGTVDQVYVVYAGRGAADTGGHCPETIWPHAWELSAAATFDRYKAIQFEGPIELDNVLLNRYACGNELRSNKKNIDEPGTINGIGTMVHEFSHCLGYPDLYNNISYGSGMGRWDVMSRGVYCGDSYIPAGYTGYERWVVGWSKPKVLISSEAVTGMKALQEGGEYYIMYNPENENEYYMLENRQKVGWDAGLYGSGLLIIHVDYDKNAWKSNVVNTDLNHLRFAYVPADNDIETNTREGDPWPYGSNNSFSKNSIPAATLFNQNTDGTYFLDFAVNDITQNADGTISFNFVNPQSPKAIWCEGNSTLYFTYDALPYNTGDTYEGNTISNVFRMGEYFGIASSVENVVISQDFKYYTSESFKSLFNSFENSESFTGLGNINTSHATDLSGMFYKCTKMPSLEGLEAWNTSNVTDMANVFLTCSSIASLEPLKNWKTDNVTTMYQMFAQCPLITSLEPLREWNTGKVTNMRSVFYQNTGITSLEALRNWDTSNVTDLTAMFYDCSGITSLEPIGNWNTSNVTTMSSIFRGCSEIPYADLSNWNTKKVTIFKNMFRYCSKLRFVTFGKDFSMENSTESHNMFQYCPKLRFIDFYASEDADAIQSVQRGTSQTMFIDVPATTVIYLPNGATQVTDETDNVVYTSNGELRCDRYYSEDKVEIELPRDFKTNEAVYTREVSNTYGSCVLPYEFKKNDDVQPYKMDQELTESTKMYFTVEETIPAHTPFIFKSLGTSPLSFTRTDETGNYGITVKATHSTNNDEYTWTGSMGEPYVDMSNINQSSNLAGWSAWGYYENQPLYFADGIFYYLSQDKFNASSGDTTIAPHRITFHSPNPSSTASVYDISTSDEVASAIKDAELRMTEREAKDIYDASGRQTHKLRRGLNIIRMSDGTAKKVVVR